MKNSNCKRFKNAFTLAETLITLAIIGIVAGLTIPSVITKYQKEQTVVQLKKAYGILQQALISSELENGFHKNWDYTPDIEFFLNKYFNKYVNYTKYSTDSSINFIQKRYYYHPNGTEMNTAHPISASGFPKMILNNGMILAFNKNSSKKCLIIYVDINGTARPNSYGYDVFSFIIYESNNNVIAEAQDRNRTEIKTNSKFGCNKTSSYGGQWCAAMIIKDNWQIKNDYPW